MRIHVHQLSKGSNNEVKLVTRHEEFLLVI